MLLFASLREAAGSPEMTLALPEHSRLSQVIDALVDALPSQRALLQRSALAVNEEYASLDDVVSEQDVIAVIPPVSGGA